MKMNVLFSIVIVLFLAQIVSANPSTCGVTYATFNDNTSVRTNINGETVNDTALSWSYLENLASETPAAYAIINDPLCSDTNPFIVTPPDLSVLLEKIHSDAIFRYADRIVVANNHLALLFHENGGDDTALYSYDYTDGSFECGVNFTVNSPYLAYAYEHKGFGDDVIVAMTDSNGIIYVASVDVSACSVNWNVAYSTPTFKPVEAGRISINSNYVEVLFGAGQAATERFLDVQLNSATGALNRGVVINTGSTAKPESIVVDSSGNAYASGIVNLYAVVFNVSGTAGSVSVNATRLASDDQNAVYQYDELPIYFCNGGNSVCTTITYEDGSYVRYSRVFVVDKATLSTARQYRTIDDVELYNMFVDQSYDNYVNLVGEDYNNGMGALMMVFAGASVIGIDLTFNNIHSLWGVASSGDYNTGNLISVIGGYYDGDLDKSFVKVQQYDTNLGNFHGFDADYNNMWGVDIHPTSDPNEFIGWATGEDSNFYGGAFLFGPYQAPGPEDVPEFSLTTLLLAVLLAGGLVLFVVRKRR